MPDQVIMPQLGESVIEGELTKWLKQPGDWIEENEPLFEVNTDKVDTELPSPASGYLLEILVEEGAIVNAGTILAWIGEKNEPIPDLGQKGDDTNSSRSQKADLPIENALIDQAQKKQLQATAKETGVGFISPVVSRIANEHNVDLNRVKGTGSNDRITKEDILHFIDSQAQNIPSEKESDYLPLTPVRRIIADHMVLSKRTSPHVTTVMEADMSSVLSHREANKESFSRAGQKLTITVYLIAASARALQNYPIVNSSWDEKGINLHQEIHIGIATSLEDEGLIVPVIKHADNFNLFDLSQKVKDLTEKARAKNLNPDDVKDGTFTITNHGVNGSLFATPIINQPQCSILGMGIIQKRVVVIGDAIAIRPMVYLSLTFDHRILDGAIADHFLKNIVDKLQRPWG
jgi:2-oxoisovalerate dehydrogenase E2 component (dihydrolipoyl transacylase)